MTPRQFHSLAERYQESKKRADRRAGELIAMFYNAHRDEEKDPKGMEWQDVFPEWKEDTEQSEEQMLQVMQLWTATTTTVLPS